jgi:hypothetical protein
MYGYAGTVGGAHFNVNATGDIVMNGSRRISSSATLYLQNSQPLIIDAAGASPAVTVNGNKAYFLGDIQTRSNIHASLHIEATNGFVAPFGSIDTNTIYAYLTNGIPGSNGVWFGMYSNSFFAFRRETNTVTYRDLMVDNNTGGGTGGNLSTTNVGSEGQIPIRSSTVNYVVFTNVISNVVFEAAQMLYSVAWGTNTSFLSVTNADFFAFTNNANSLLLFTNLEAESTYAKTIVVMVTNVGSSTLNFTNCISGSGTQYPIIWPNNTPLQPSPTNISVYTFIKLRTNLYGNVVTNFGGTAVLGF